MYASYINNKMNELDAVEAFRRFPVDMKSVLVHLNIADDYFKAKAYVEKLEKGVVPDFEQAKAAANAVNDFNNGISNILGFDPMTALAEAQKKERYGDEQ